MKIYFSVILFSILFSARFNYAQIADSFKPEIKDFYTTSTDSVKLFTRVSGKGPVCIFVHGGPGAWSKSFEDFGGLHLEDFLTMVYYDQRGCGRSDNAKDYSLNKMVEDIECIRKQLKADSVYLLAHSFGGIIAANYALKYPEHIKGLILANATLNVYYSLQQQIDHVNFLLTTKIKAQNNDSILPKFLEARKLLAGKGYDYLMLSDNKLSVEKVNLIDQANPSKNDFAEKVWNIKEYFTDFTPLTEKIKTPALIITGKKDYSVGVEHYLQFKFPNKIVSRLNGGHLLYIDRNDEFVFVINTFVKHGLYYDEEKEFLENQKQGN